MKKSVALTVAFLLCSGQAWAYTNAHAGYSVKDGVPFYKMESSKVYAFSGFKAKPLAELEKAKSGSVHVINYYTAQEMEQIIGSPFTTAYFNEQFDQMALLKRSQLDVRTIPVPLLDLEKYAAFDHQNNNTLERKFFDKKFAELDPIIDLQEVGGRKVITLLYLYKRDNTLISVQTSLLSANDQLYILSTANYDGKILTESKQEEEMLPGQSLKKKLELSDAGSKEPEPENTVAEAINLETVHPDTIDKAILDSFKNIHKKFLQGFRTSVPTEASKPLSYTDTIAGNTIELPQDWVYGQLQFKEKEATGNVGFAAPMPMLQKMLENTDYTDILALEQDTAEEDTQDLATVLGQESKSTARKLLPNFDAMLLTCSFKAKDVDLKEMLSASRVSKIQAELMVMDFLSGLKRYDADYFALQSADYALDYTEDATKLTINTDAVFLKEFPLTSLLHLKSGKDFGSALLYSHKNGFEPGGELEKSISQWQF